MAGVRYSARAERDLMGIADFTLRQWGEDQVVRYLDGLEACCQKLAVSPALGRTCDEIRPGLRRMEHGKHVIFYRAHSRGILVLRILHQGMLPGRQPMEGAKSSDPFTGPDGVSQRPSDVPRVLTHPVQSLLMPRGCRLLRRCGRLV